MIIVKYNQKEEEKIHLSNNKLVEEEREFSHSLLIEERFYWRLELYHDEIHWFNLTEVRNVSFLSGCDTQDCDICIWEEKEDEE